MAAAPPGGWARVRVRVRDRDRVRVPPTLILTLQERLSFQHLIHLKYAGEPVALRLLRGGEELHVDVPVYPQALARVRARVGLGLGLVP